MRSKSRTDPNNKLTSVVGISYGPKRYINEGVGIEVELEGSVSPIEPSPYWTSKPDSSLREGYEYVLRFPVGMDKLEGALDELTGLLKKMKPESSIRTSTHIHVNVTTLTNQQVYNVVFLYYLLEELFIRTMPRERIGNLFCLRMKDSNMIYQMLRWSLSGGTYFWRFNEEEAKYAALNLCTVAKYGSLEFRFLPAYWDKATLLRWSQVFHQLIYKNKDRNIQDVLDMYEDLPVKDFIKKILPGHHLWLTAGLTSDSLNDLLHTNYDALRELSRVSLGSDKYSLPPGMWNDDAEVFPEIHDWSSKYLNTDWNGLAEITQAAQLNAFAAGFDAQPTPPTPPQPAALDAVEETVGWNWDAELD